MKNRIPARIRYGLMGAGFGLCFPILAGVITYLEQGVPWNEAMWARESMLRYVIDTAPLFLGFFAFLIGAKQDRLTEHYESLMGAHHRSSIQTTKAIIGSNLGAIAVLAGLVLLTFVVCFRYSHDHAYYGSVINRAGKQRMLFQRGMGAADIIFHSRGEKRAEAETYLHDVNDALREGAAYLTTYMGQEESSVVYGLVQEQLRAVESLSSHFDNILMYAGGSRSQGGNLARASYKQLVANRDAYEKLLDDTVHAFEKAERDEASSFLQSNILLTFLTLSVLGLQFVLIFFPAVMRIENQIREISRTKDELEHAEKIGRFGSFRYLPGQDVLACSPGCSTLFGGRWERVDLTLSDLLGKVHKEDRELVKAALANDDRNSLSQETEFRFSSDLTDPGAVRWLRMKLSSQSHGDQVALFGTIYDASEAMEARIRFQLAVEGSSVGLWDWNIISGQEYWSPRMYELLGYRDGEITSSLESFSDLLHPDDKDRTFQLVEAHFQNKAPFDLEYRLRHKSGEYRWYRGTGKVMFGMNQQPVRMVGSILDIHEEHLAKRSLERARDEAEAASRAKASFLANMSHEIRTPMNGIIGMTDLLMDSCSDPAELEKFRIIQSCGQTLLELINDILDFSKLEADKVDLENKPFNLVQVIRDVVGLFGATASSKGVLLTQTLDPQTPDWVSGDATRFRQVLSNLVSNAIKFTEAGTVHVETRVTMRDESKATVEFSISDTGIGISDDVRGKLFKPFSQVDASTTRRFGGTGLGLAITHDLVARMGGKIWVESTPNSGSTFFFRLSWEEADSVDVAAQKNNPIKFTDSFAKDFPHRILVAEDNKTNQIVISGMLQKLGYFPTVVSNGKEALEKVRESFFDIILMDFHMPVMDGVAATKAIQEEIPEERRPRVFALTASTLQEDVEKCFAVGMKGFMAKPITLPNLTAILSEGKVSVLGDSQKMKQRSASAYDREKFLLNFGGLDDLAQATAREFLVRIDEMYRPVAAAFQQGNYQALEVAVHSLKGAASIFCCDKVHSIAERIESLSRQGGDLKEIGNLISGLDIALAALRQDLEEDFLGGRVA